MSMLLGSRRRSHKGVDVVTDPIFDGVQQDQARNDDNNPVDRIRKK